MGLNHTKGMPGGGKEEMRGGQKSQANTDVNPAISKPTDRPPQPENKSIKVSVLSFGFIKKATGKNDFY